MQRQSFYWWTPRPRVGHRKRWFLQWGHSWTSFICPCFISLYWTVSCNPCHTCWILNEQDWNRKNRKWPRYETCLNVLNRRFKRHMVGSTCPEICKYPIENAPFCSMSLLKSWKLYCPSAETSYSSSHCELWQKKDAEHTWHGHFRFSFTAQASEIRDVCRHRTRRKTCHGFCSTDQASAVDYWRRMFHMFHVFGPTCLKFTKPLLSTAGGQASSFTGRFPLWPPSAWALKHGFLYLRSWCVDCYIYIFLKFM